MSNRKKIILLILLVFVAIQLIRPERNISSTQAIPGDIKSIVAVPQNVEMVLKSACYDCHSNNTIYPWYMNIQPAGWFMAYHVKNGKEELNFNEFGSYSLRKQQHKLKSIADQVNSVEMPLSSYTLIHRYAILSKEQKQLIITWAKNAQNNLNVKN